ncbi:MAG TPA: polyhydroxyalkanoate depolymerase [Bdellovibrionota bacterium]|nr:polyhydroxyalkanoate depolymerase [Bdellovibrionota bacterium]
MKYLNYFNDFKESALAPLHSFSLLTEAFLDPLPIPSLGPLQKYMMATSHFLERETRIFDKPKFEITEVKSEDTIYQIEEKTVMKKPFCNLKHFKKVGFTKHQEVVVVFAPYSGHHATLLRDTVKTLLQDFDVYITDWVSASLVPMNEGDFNLEHYIDYVLDFIRHFKGDCHILAVCQPAVPVLIASSLLAQYKEPSQPKSMVLMGGPVDARVNPGPVNTFSKEHDMDWFEDNLVTRVGPSKKGAGRLICPGFLLLDGFMILNLERHEDALKNYYNNLVIGDMDSAHVHEKFYDEYRSVLDLPAHYYLDSINIAFKRHDLAKGRYRWRGHLVDPGAITKTALMSVEGEKDDISCPGQTLAAHDLCKNLPAHKKDHHMQKAVGHYGLFNGTRWRTQIYPHIREFMWKNA